MSELLDLCYDVMIRILEEINPGDLAACAQTSTAFNHFIKDNTPLYKAHYLRSFDDPRRKPTDGEPEWITELQRVVRCQKILISGNLDVKRENFSFVNSTINSLIASASEDSGQSRNITSLSSLFGIPGNLDAFLYRSTLYTRSETSYSKVASTEEDVETSLVGTSPCGTSTEEDRQLSAKVHTLYGIPDTTAGRRALRRVQYAKSRVYDLRYYTDANGWGPYLNDGSMRVDWEALEAMMVDLTYNSKMCCRRFLEKFTPPWSSPFEGIAREKNMVSSLPEWDWNMLNQSKVPLAKRDPYGIEGVWARIVCFLDYNDLYHFNFSDAAGHVKDHEPRGPIGADEAVRHIFMRLRVTQIEAPGPDDNPSHPIVHFTGTSRAVDATWDPNANSRIKGSVRMTKEGEVRWATISVLYGEERWRSEGIQVGGIGARRGVLGTWFDKDFDEHGPAGPTCFWKVENSTTVEHGDSDSDDIVEFVH